MQFDFREILLQQEKGESSEEKFESHKYKMQDKITMYTSLVVVAAVFRFGISTIMPSLFWFLGPSGRGLT